ncbi:MAG: DUF6653 family protein [Bacteroidota bacterium]
MTLERKIAKAFNLTHDNWMKHSNPWSVWTRYSVLPIIVFAFWSRIWIGWWCLVPAGVISLLWMFFNPVFFKKPKSTRNEHHWPVVFDCVSTYWHRKNQDGNEEYKSWDY